MAEKVVQTAGSHILRLKSRVRIVPMNGLKLWMMSSMGELNDDH